MNDLRQLAPDMARGYYAAERLFTDRALEALQSGRNPAPFLRDADINRRKAYAARRLAHD